MCCNSKAFDCDEWFVSCSDEEVKAISIHKGIDSNEYFYIGNREGSKNNAIKTLENGDCVFKTDKGCGVYSVRPEVCKKFAESSPCLFFPERSTLVSN